MKTDLKKTRKQLPSFGVVSDIKIDIESIISFCKENDYFNISDYNDINVSSKSPMTDFVIANSVCKNSFFKDTNEPDLESELYKQKYITEMYTEKLTKDRKKYMDKIHVANNSNVLKRTRRLNPKSHSYNPAADEHNYGKRNHLSKGEVENVLNKFKGKLTRVRFAYLAPGFSLKPHIDYDPSYITRFHIPLITNDKCLMGVKVKGETQKVHFPANGNVYFLNSGLTHWAENNSDIERIHLIVDTKDQTDLENLQPYYAEHVNRA